MTRNSTGYGLATITEDRPRNKIESLKRQAGQSISGLSAHLIETSTAEEAWGAFSDRSRAKMSVSFQEVPMGDEYVKLSL